MDLAEFEAAIAQKLAAHLVEFGRVGEAANTTATPDPVEELPKPAETPDNATAEAIKPTVKPENSVLPGAPTTESDTRGDNTYGNPYSRQASSGSYESRGGRRQRRTIIDRGQEQSPVRKARPIKNARSRMILPRVRIPGRRGR